MVLSPSLRPHGLLESAANDCFWGRAPARQMLPPLISSRISSARPFARPPGSSPTPEQNWPGGCSTRTGRQIVARTKRALDGWRARPPSASPASEGSSHPPPSLITARVQAGLDSSCRPPAHRAGAALAVWSHPFLVPVQADVARGGPVDRVVQEGRRPFFPPRAPRLTVRVILVSTGNEGAVPRPTRGIHSGPHTPPFCLRGTPVRGSSAIIAMARECPSLEAQLMVCDDVVPFPRFFRGFRGNPPCKSQACTFFRAAIHGNCPAHRSPEREKKDFPDGGSSTRPLAPRAAPLSIFIPTGFRRDRRKNSAVAKAETAVCPLDERPPSPQASPRPLLSPFPATRVGPKNSSLFQESLCCLSRQSARSLT